MAKRTTEDSLRLLNRPIPDDRVPAINESLFFPKSNDGYFELIRSARSPDCFWYEAVSLVREESVWNDRPIRRGAILWFAEREGFDLLTITPSRSEADSEEMDEIRYEQWRQRAIPKPDRPAKKVKLTRTHFIYFMQSVDGGPIKIGASWNVDDRRSQLQVYSPRPLIILGTLRASDGYSERRIHKQFAADRLHNEWFDDSPELLDFIRTHATPWEASDD